MKRKYQVEKVFGIGKLNDFVSDAITDDISILVDFINQIAAKQFIDDSDDAKLLLSQIIVGRELGAPSTKPLTWYNDKGEFLGYLVSELYVKNGRKISITILISRRSKNGRKCLSGIDMKASVVLKTKFFAKEASTRALNSGCPERSIVNEFVAKCKELSQA